MTDSVQEAKAKEQDRVILLAIFDKVSSWPKWKQILAGLVFMAICAICFQLIHGFSLLCKYSNGYACIGEVPKRDTVAYRKYRDDKDKKLDSMLVLMQAIPEIKKDIDSLQKDSHEMKKALNLLATYTGTSEKIERALRPRPNPHSIFPDVSFVH